MRFIIPNLRKMADSKIKFKNLKSIFLKSVESVKPSLLIKNSVMMKNSNLSINNDVYSLYKPCYVVGFGKAVLDMAVTLESILEDNLAEGIVTVPVGSLTDAARNSRIQFIEGAYNNLPDEAAEEGAKLIKNLVEKLQRDDLLVVLISGGGSALLPLPKHPVTLSEKLAVIKDLSFKGADIKELNCVRKCLSVLKGGGLARLAYPAKVVSLILSDIVDDPLDYIASGPTTQNLDNSTVALDILRKYSLYNQLPESVKVVLETENNSDDVMNKKYSSVMDSIRASNATDPSENIIDEDASYAENYVKGNNSVRASNATNQSKNIMDKDFSYVTNYVIGNNAIAARAAFKQASILGYQTCILSTRVKGDVDKISNTYAGLAREVASLIASDKTSLGRLKLFLTISTKTLNLSESAIKEISNLNFQSSTGVCLIFAGEPTVVVTGSGKGGRNQQLALAFSIEINKFDIKSANISFLSCGTDGIDGPTDAAGAIGGSNLVHNAIKEGINPSEFLANNDSYNFYLKYMDGDNLIRTGHTGTNVMDIHILTVSPKIECKCF